MAPTPAEPLSCPGCGLALPPLDGPTHPYIGASPACWALYGELLGRAASWPPDAHRLAVDAYAVQHPGVPGRREVRSVALHLMVLCLAIEHGLRPAHATAAITRLAEAELPLRWLAPPQPNGTITVADVLGARSPRERVATWARDVWEAWRAHHATVEGWLREAGWGQPPAGAGPRPPG